jgi:hypothetical protein
VRPYPDVFAHHDVIAAHFATLQRSGKYVLLRESIWLSYATRHSLPFAYALCFLAPKSTPLLRLVSFPFDLIHPVKKSTLEHVWGPISPPQLLDICVQLATAYVCFPNTEIVIARRDVDDAYRLVSGMNMLKANIDA